MPIYHFNLLEGCDRTEDFFGTDLPDEAAAKEHAVGIALELIRNREAKVRHWRLDVCDSDGGLVFALPLVRVDPSLDLFSPAARSKIEQWCERYQSLGEAIHSAKVTVRQSRALVARSRGKPYLAAENGEHV